MVTSAATSFCAALTRKASLALAVNLDAAFLERVDERSQVLRLAVGEQKIAAGDCAGSEEGSGFDAVWDDGMRRAVELFDSLDTNGGRAGAFDAGAHLGEKRGEVGDFGFEGAVFENGFAVGKDGGGEDVFRAGNGDLG